MIQGNKMENIKYSDIRVNKNENSKKQSLPANQNNLRYEVQEKLNVSIANAYNIYNIIILIT